MEEEYEALLQFLYLVPVGVVQFAPDGTIGMLNPLCAQLLMPLSSDGGLDNLFSALDDTIDYVLTLRMRPVKVKLRLLAGAERGTRYVLVQRA